jgi:hypothetical protein
VTRESCRGVFCVRFRAPLRSENIFYDEKSSKPNSFLCWHYLICDDGNLTQEAINFEDITTQSCNTNDVVIQIKGKPYL